jgi:hypothetical protein
MRIVAAATLLLGIGMWTSTAHAQDDPCACEASICNAQGFEIALTDSSINQVLGESSWTYQVCVNHAECYCAPEY